MTTTKHQLLSWLKDNRHRWVSGEQISNRLGISRTAIWKHIKSLKQAGHRIEAATKKGYRLQEAVDLITPEGVQASLQTRIMGRPGIIVLDETDSTNVKAKEMAHQGAQEGTVVVADTQTRGRGRRGRTWFSPSGRNIYASIVLRPSLAPSQAPQITLMTAVAMAGTISASTGSDAKIKWPNDILMGGKKIAGILTEISTEMDVVDFVVVGVGINVNVEKEEMPDEIQEIATSMAVESGRSFARDELLCRLLQNFEAGYKELITRGPAAIMQQWREMTDILGQRVRVDMVNRKHVGIVQGVDDDGVLILKDDKGEAHRIFSGDVTKLRASNRPG